tara:strand:+ start:976 stop:1197 length:222 start_codon:yes stop_codon:yes gene_type:complete
MDEIFIKKTTNNQLNNDIKKIELSNEILDNIPMLITTINDLIKVINMRLNLTEEEKECIKTIKDNIDYIEKSF